MGDLAVGGIWAAEVGAMAEGDILEECITGGDSISVEESAIIGAEASVYTAEAGLVSTAAREVFTEATALGVMASDWG